MHKAATLTLATFALASTGYAQEVGIGMSFKQGENTIYLPVRTKGGMLIEGFFSYFHNNQSSSYANPSTPPGQSSNSYSVLEPGVGIFWLRALSENSHVYFGPRLGYLYSKQDSGDSFGGWESRSHGFAVRPTLGFEYFPIKRVSIGGEVGYNFARMSGHSNPTSGTVGTTTYENASNGTVTSVLVRIYF